MASNVLVLLLSAGIFTITAGFERCSIVKNDGAVCDFWKSEFCCGTCDKSYCCTDPQKKFTIDAQSDCIVKDDFPTHSQSYAIAVGASILGLVAIIILFIICLVYPRCYLYKRFRNPGPVATTTTVVTRQYLPQPSAVIQGGQYLPFQALPNNPPYGGQPMPPPAYQEAVGPGYSVPIQVVYDGGQSSYPLQSSPPTDYTSPQPACNPVFFNHCVP